VDLLDLFLGTLGHGRSSPSAGAAFAMFFGNELPHLADMEPVVPFLLSMSFLFPDFSRRPCLFLLASDPTSEKIFQG